VSKLAQIVNVSDLSLVSVVCCQVEVSVTCQSLVQRSHTECGVTECDIKTLILRKPKPTGTVKPWKKNSKLVIQGVLIFLHFIYIFLTFSITFSFREKLSALCHLISNQIILQCTKSVNLESVFQGNTRAGLGMFENIIECCLKYRLQYDKVWCIWNGSSLLLIIYVCLYKFHFISFAIVLLVYLIMLSHLHAK